MSNPRSIPITSSISEVISPSHYIQGGYECANVVDVLLPTWTAAGLDSHRVAAAFEYIFRAGVKGTPHSDLAKALNYLHRAIYGTWFPFPDSPGADSPDTNDRDNF